MNISPASITAARVALGLGFLLVAGCSTPRPQVGVTVPPPPLIGSAPIAAYDDYALVIAPQASGGAQTFALISPR